MATLSFQNIMKWHTAYYIVVRIHFFFFKTLSKSESETEPDVSTINRMSFVTNSFLIGTLSGAVEPIFAVLTLLMFSIISPAMPYFLAFAAGAMIYVVVDELIREASLGTHNNFSTFSFAIGFCVMMILDVVFG